MIFDFGKLKNSISSSCISRKSITSHTKLCNSVRHFYYRLGRAATAMRAQMSKIFGHVSTNVTESVGLITCEISPSVNVGNLDTNELISDSSLKSDTLICSCTRCCFICFYAVCFSILKEIP